MVKVEPGNSAHELVGRGSLFTLTGYGVSLLLRLASNVVLARLLFPEAFGLMALVAVVIQGLHMLSDVGLQQLIIRHERGVDRVFLNTAWTVQIIRGLFLWLITVLVAQPVAVLYEDPQLAALIPAAGLISILAGFNSTALSTEKRRLRLGRLTLVELIAQFLSMVVMIAIALIHPTVWALVAGSITAFAVTLVLSHIWLADSRDGFALDRATCRELFTFGKWIFLSTLLTFLVGQSDKILFGKLISLETLGVYSIATVFAAIPAGILGRIGQSVIFPAYCRILSAGTADFADAFYGLRTPFVFVGVIGVSLLFLLAPALVNLLYDDRYHEADWMLQILLVGTLFRLLENTNGQALLAYGNARIVAAGSLGKLIAMLVMIFTGFAWFGFPGAVAGYAFSEIVRYLISVIATSRYSIGSFKMDSALIVVWLTVTGFSLYVSSFLETSGCGNLAAAVASTLLACVIWGSSYWLLVASGLFPKGSFRRLVRNEERVPEPPVERRTRPARVPSNEV